jgi:hypothetical protein
MLGTLACCFGIQVLGICQINTKPILKKIGENNRKTKKAKNDPRFFSVLDHVIDH